jgi:hypothetical protein
VAALVASAFGAPGASAAPIPEFEPLTTNVPYLAWRGEQLRLVKCLTPQVDGEAAVALMKDENRRFEFDWLVEDWSGYPFQPPQLEKSTVASFRGNGEYWGAPCVKASFVSLKAGLAQIKLVISDSRTGNPVVKHQFLAGWLALNTPTIREVSAATGATDPPGGGGVLGDPAGDGIFIAGSAPGRVQIQVTGFLPLGNNFTELGLPTTCPGGAATCVERGMNLPTEPSGDTLWDDLARAMATTSNFLPFYRDAPWRMWDIHDDRARTEGHVSLGLCPPGPLHATLDAVDSCLGAHDAEGAFIGDGEYSRAFNDTSAYPTWGPFDPLRPDETLLPDGKLDAGDVPMPSALVEVGITPNSGAPTDIGGVGSLSIVSGGNHIGVFKCIAYTRDNKCTSLNGSHPASTPSVAPPPYGPAPHNHYAPYYSRWIPATYAQVDGFDSPFVREASGNDGPPIGNNFPGYRGSGLYDYWQFADVLNIASGGNTTCRERGGRYFQRPSGPQRVMVFSDEHGEAQVYFNPGTGFYADRLGVGPNLNGGCELRDVTDLGFADITAIARYPYQKVTDPDKPSNTIRKILRHRFSKTVTCVPKGPVPPIENSFAFICTATVIDITGARVAGEKVCFTTGGPGSEGLIPFPLGTAHTIENGFVCILTNSNGQASVEVFGKCGAGNVLVFFPEEGLIRVATFTFGCPTAPATPGTPGAPGATPPAGTPPSVIPPEIAPSVVPPANAAQIAKVIQQSSAKPAVKASLAFARIQKQAFAKLSKRYVLVRVNGSQAKARVQVTLIGKRGKILGKVTRTVRTNRSVRVPNLTLKKAVITARVRLLT